MKLINQILRQPVHATFGRTANGVGAGVFISDAQAQFDTLADLALSSVRSDADLVATLGHTSVGDNGGALYRRVLAEPGHGGKIQSADGAWFELVPAPGGVLPEQFGARGDGATDDTAAIQAAVNFASQVQAHSVRLRAVHYVADTVLCYHDATLNPGYNSSARHAKVRLVGAGTVDISFLRVGRLDFGTVLEFTGAGLIVSSDSAGHDGGNYPARKFHAEGITFVASNTGYVIELASCPEAHILDCAVLQQNPAGGGIYFHSSWYGKIENSFIMNNQPNPTGVGLHCGTSIFAGLFTVEKSLIDGFRDCVEWSGGTFVNVLFRDTAIQNAGRYSMHATGGELRHLTLDNCYFEGVSRTSDIKASDNEICHLTLREGFFLAGSQTTSHVSGPIIDLPRVESVDIANAHVFRPWQTFCNIGAANNGQSIGEARGCSFIHDNTGAIAGSVFLFTGRLPVLRDNTWSGMHTGLYASGAIRLHDPAISNPMVLHDKQSNTLSIGRLALGAVTVEAGLSGTYNVGGGTNRVVYDLTNIVASSVTLPTGATVPDGRAFLIGNNAASVAALNVRNSADNSLVLSLAPGQGAWFVLDRGTDRYLAFRS